MGQNVPIHEANASIYVAQATIHRIRFMVRMGNKP